MVNAQPSYHRGYIGFVYVALAPMRDISLKPYKNVLAWIERIKKLSKFFPIQGLGNPDYRRDNPNQK